MIKKTLMTFVITLMLFGCQNETKAQNTKDTPEAVKMTFQAKYPGENDPDWKLDSNGNYESHFKIDGIKYRADFSPDGKWIETETNIDKKDLPKAIREAIKEQYDSEEITEIEKVMHPTKGTFYDVEFKQKGKNHDVEFTADGKIIGESNRKKK